MIHLKLWLPVIGILSPDFEFFYFVTWFMRLFLYFFIKDKDGDDVCWGEKKEYPWTEKLENFCEVYDENKTRETEIWTSQKKLRSYPSKTRDQISIFSPLLFSLFFLKCMRKENWSYVNLQIRKSGDFRSVWRP